MLGGPEGAGRGREEREEILAGMSAGLLKLMVTLACGLQVHTPAVCVLPYACTQ